MKSPIVIIGIGELGGIFARGFLRLGHPVYPVTRAIPMAAVAEELTEPELVLVAVTEGDLAPLFDALPDTWRGCLGLIQNELLPDHWKGIPAPTVISVWFEKKPGTDPQGYHSLGGPYRTPLRAGGAVRRDDRGIRG